MTKNAKRVRAGVLLLALLLVGKTIQFGLTHHREDYNCKWNYEVAGYMCQTKWVANTK